MSIIYLPHFNPSIFEIGFISIRYYSLAYIIGILLAMFFINNENKKSNFMPKEAQEDWLIWAVLSIILGGRIGYVLFYNFQYFINHPLEILAVWQGGMSFHGGLIGSLIGLYLFCKKYNVDIYKIGDNIAIIAPIGIFLGRLANFINLELYGRPTNENYGFVFPNDPLQIPRHPSQLYEAFLEGLLIFIILFTLDKTTKIKNIKGVISGIFMVLYALARLIVENFREPDLHIGEFEILSLNITLGQILSAPILIFGIWLLTKAVKSNKLGN